MREVKTFEELENPVNLTVKTKCPEKWMLVDREIGQVYIGNQMGVWDRLDPVIRDS